VLGTVEKAARVLALFTDGKPEWGVTEVRHALGVPKSSAHSMLSALAEAGFLDRTEENRYRLGLQMLTLSRAVLDSSPALRHVDSAIHTLVQRYGVTVHVGGLDDDEGIYLDKVRGTRVQPPAGNRRPPSAQAMELGRVPSAVGRRFPGHATALGKVLLAYAPPETVERMIERRGLPALTTATITSPDALLAELSATRDRGWALSREEGVPGVCCYAAAIFDDQRRVDVAISVSVTSEEDHAHPGQYAQLALAASKVATKRLREDRTWGAAADLVVA
jgi:DNA-binding IclR family transcriptional regulator